jgi:hypothetical protein
MLKDRAYVFMEYVTISTNPQQVIYMVMVLNPCLAQPIKKQEVKIKS